MIFNFSSLATNNSPIARSNLNIFKETCQKLNTELTKKPECAAPVCNISAPYRTISGCCNNIAITNLGSAHTPFDRLMPSEYSDNISLPRGGMNPSKLPNPRVVSSAIHRVQETEPKPPISLMVMQFGQFLDHDMTLTPEQGWLKPETLKLHCFVF